MLQYLKLGFLLTVSHITAECSQNFQYDRVILLNGSSEYLKTKTSRNETESSLEIINAFAWQNFLKTLSLIGNSECQNHVNIVFQEAGNLSFWALQMLDASAKLPSGILSGNLNQFGDFDECLTSEAILGNQIIKGKYCLANIEIKSKKSKINTKLQLLDDAIHSHRMLTNKLKDQGHRIPRLETFNWGICVPASCHKKEIEVAFNNFQQEISKRTPFDFEINLNDDVCYVDEKNEVSITNSITKLVFASIFILIIIGTILDTKKLIFLNLKWTEIFRCFSLKRNWTLLIKTESAADEIKCLHGARFINAIALLLSHKQIAMLFTPTTNRTEMAQAFTETWTMLGRTAILYTDSFIMFSGLLASYSLVKDLDNGKKINFKDKLMNRFVRFTPSLLSVILFCTFLMDSLNSGPQWGLVVTKYSDLCKKYMWRNLIYIHNYFGFENMCLTHTHQLGIDMQLFIISPIFIYLLWKTPLIGTLIMFLAAVASTWLRFEVTYRERLSTLLYYGISVERLWKTANLSYILPSHRLTVYLVGIFMGYYLRRGGKVLNFNRFQVAFGWILSTVAGLVAIFGPYQASFQNYSYDAKIASYFNAFAPILWVTFLSWILLASFNGYGGFFNNILSWKYFIIFTRISYAIYLTQFPIFFYNVGKERSSQYYKGFFSLFDIVEYSTIFIASLILTLAIDIPFQELKKRLSNEPRKTIKTDNKKNDVQNLEVVQNIKHGRTRKNRIQPFGN